MPVVILLSCSLIAGAKGRERPEKGQKRKAAQRPKAAAQTRFGQEAPRQITWETPLCLIPWGNSLLNYTKRSVAANRASFASCRVHKCSSVPLLLCLHAAVLGSVFPLPSLLIIHTDKLLFYT